MGTKIGKKGKRYRVKIIDQKKLKTLRGMLKHKTYYYEAMVNDPAFDSFVDAGIRNTEHEIDDQKVGEKLDFFPEQRNKRTKIVVDLSFSSSTDQTGSHHL